MIRELGLSPVPSRCRQGRPDVYSAVQMSVGPSRCLQGRPDVCGAVQMSTRPSRCREGRPEALGLTWCRRDGRGAAGMDVVPPCGRPEMLRVVQNRGEVSRDLPRTGETCRGRERSAEDGRDVPRTGETCRGRERVGTASRGSAATSEGQHCGQSLPDVITT